MDGDTYQVRCAAQSKERGFLERVGFKKSQRTQVQTINNALASMPGPHNGFSFHVQRQLLVVHRYKSHIITVFSRYTVLHF